MPAWPAHLPRLQGPLPGLPGLGPSGGPGVPGSLGSGPPHSPGSPGSPVGVPGVRESGSPGDQLETTLYLKEEKREDDWRV